LSKQRKENLAPVYDSADVESQWYEIWNQGGYFKAKEGKQKETYSIVMPPPNVTGMLHAGHALDVTTQDAMIRYKRMKGFETLWIPGMDHAGIATQSVVEKMLVQEGTNRHQLGRDTFIEKVWEWKEKYGGIIANQQRSMGASPDWDYSLFTMDPEANEAVNTFFVNLYNRGLIYQSDYIINWDPSLQSAISDAEVEHREVQGAFYHIHYTIQGSDQKLEVATTRPETLLGDTAVSVNPNDERYKHLIGQTAIVPICNREVPIIGDEHVDIELGTGCLKVTPGHDFNDFEIGQRHDLKIVNILNKDGSLNAEAGAYEGLSCLDARPKIVEELQSLGLFVKTVEHVHQVGHGDRSGAVIEPMVSKQWFLNVQGMAGEAVSAVKDDRTRFFPKGWENTFFSWLEDPKNWCISRQLWWGHRIPVFNCSDCSHQWASKDQPDSCPSCSSSSVDQDPDVLDTWFSSGLWPLSTLGWPDSKRMEEKGFDRFYPTSCLVTGFDIIFFWVARMMMMGIEETKNVPFKHVYIHAIVRDKLGRKMSKSLGNGIDPLEMIDTYGADAFRFTLAAGSGYNRGLNLDPERIGGYRNFINKIWNAFRFIHPFIDDAPGTCPDVKTLDHHERWILSELNEVAKVVNESMDEYRYDDACSAIYTFIYERYCSWFIELSKKILHGEDISAKERRLQVLKYGFRQIVALLHPFTPYITEELWMYLREDNEDLLIVREYPEWDASLQFTSDREQMNHFIETISHIRNLRASVDIKPKDVVPVHLYTDQSDLKTYFEENRLGFSELAKAQPVKVFSKDEQRPEKSVMSATTATEIFLPLDGVDLDEQIERLEKELKKAKDGLGKFEKKLENTRFTENAPAEVIAETREKAEAMQEKVKSLENNLANFQN
jgi:valyl-tRNA synthetase